EADQIAGNRKAAAAPDEVGAPSPPSSPSSQPAQSTTFNDETVAQVAQVPTANGEPATQPAAAFAEQPMQQQAATGQAAPQRPAQFIIARGLTQQQRTNLNDTLCEQNGGRVLIYQCSNGKLAPTTLPTAATASGLTPVTISAG